MASYLNTQWAAFQPSVTTGEKMRFFSLVTQPSPQITGDGRLSCASGDDVADTNNWDAETRGLAREDGRSL